LTSEIILLVMLTLVLTSATTSTAHVRFQQEPVIELNGILTQGVETGCVLLHADDGRLYNLVNVTADHPPFGSRVLVRGYVERDVATVCMQGIPFRILRIQVVSAQSSASTSRMTTERLEGTRTNRPAGEPQENTQPIPLPSESVILGIAIALAVLEAQKRRNRPL
jgi:hypothetical protein